MKNIFKVLLTALFFALIALGLISCSARKVDKSTEKIQQNYTESTEEKKKDNSTINTQTEKENATSEETKLNTEEFTITPVDIDKPIIIIDSNGKETKVHNGIISTKKDKSETNKYASEKEKSELTEKKDIIEQKKSQKEDTLDSKKEIKQVEKQAFNWINFVIPIIISLLFVFGICKLLKKYYL